MTIEERKQKASKLFKDLEILLTNLYVRWLEKKDYEDIKDYSFNIKPEVEKIGGQFIKMNKRPFGFTFILYDATYQFKIANNQYSYIRIS